MLSARMETANSAARMGHTVSLVDIHAHTGGVVSGGLVATDMGDRKTVRGLADEFHAYPVCCQTQR